jgi:hypothetical protein
MTSSDTTTQCTASPQAEAGLVMGATAVGQAGLAAHGWYGAAAMVGFQAVPLLDIAGSVDRHHLCVLVHMEPQEWHSFKYFLFTAIMCEPAYYVCSIRSTRVFWFQYFLFSDFAFHSIQTHWLSLKAEKQMIEIHVLLNVQQSWWYILPGHNASNEQMLNYFLFFVW